MRKEIHQSWLVVVLCVGIMVGTVVGLVCRVNYFASGWWVAVVVILLVVVYLKPRVAFVVVAGLVAGVVLALFRVSGELYGQEYIRQFYGVEVVVTGVVQGDPEVDEEAMKFRLTGLEFGEGCGGEGECYVARGDLYVTAGATAELARSDKVMLKGKMLEGFGVYAGYMYRPAIIKWEKPEPGDMV